TLAVDTESGTLELPVIADPAVDPSFGTGVVKVTPAHDPADWEMGQRHGLALRSVIGTDGRMTPEAGRYAGLDRFECRKRVVEDLRAMGLLEREDPTTCPACSRAALVQESDVLDTWFSSALWPFSTLGWPDRTEDLARYYPTTVLVTGFDIIFFWVARMMMMGLRFTGDVPF